MFKTVRHIVVELACQLPDWIFLTAGVVILGAAAVIPPYLENRQILWQANVLNVQAQRKAEEAQDTRAAVRAFDAHDPVLLERTSYYYLHLKPSGTTPVVRVNGSTVDQWLRRPVPRAGVDYPAYSPVESWVTDTLTGPLRIWALAAGIAMVFLGLVPVNGRRAFKLGRAASAADTKIGAETAAPVPIVSMKSHEEGAPATVSVAPALESEPAVVTAQMLPTTPAARERSAEPQLSFGPPPDTSTASI